MHALQETEVHVHHHHRVRLVVADVLQAQTAAVHQAQALVNSASADCQKEESR